MALCPVIDLEMAIRTWYSVNGAYVEIRVIKEDILLNYLLVRM